MNVKSKVTIWIGLVTSWGSISFTGFAVADSSPVYPQQRSFRSFSHRKHAQMRCGSCHPKAANSASANDDLAPTVAVCRSCHVGGDSTRTRSGRAVARQARLFFSHKLHKRRHIACARCHEVSKKDKGRSMTLPRMKTCLDCHRQKKVTNRCIACHPAHRDGRLVTKFQNERLVPQGTLHNDAHTAMFRRRHGSVARANESYCRSCHAQNECLKCHAGTYKPISFHPGDYISNHIIDARRNQPRCQGCHRSQTFCLSCHQRSGAAQDSVSGGFSPNTGVRFHPPEFTKAVSGPGHHGFAARRNPMACASCHEERTCVRCHATRSNNGGGFSPHRANFRTSSRCRSLAKRNSRMCLKCHRMSDTAWRCQ